MQLRDSEGGFAHVDTGDSRPALSHGLAEDAAAAAYIEDLFAGQVNALVNPVDPQRVDVVQRLELAFAVPPAMGKRLEFGDLGVVDVAHG